MQRGGTQREAAIFLKVTQYLHWVLTILYQFLPLIPMTPLPLQQRVDTKALEAAHKLLRPLMLRRVKDEVWGRGQGRTHGLILVLQI